MTYRKERRRGIYCDDGWCSRVAEWNVKDEDNSVIGQYCTIHASERVTELNQAEEAAQAKNEK